MKQANNQPNPLNKWGDDWGVGLDYLFKDIWPNLDQIRKDNTNYLHNEENIEHCFLIMRSILIKEVPTEIKKTDWSVKDKIEVMQKVANILAHFRDARTINDKVIAINIAEQLLRTIY